MASTNNVIQGSLQVQINSTLAGNVAKNTFQSSAPLTFTDKVNVSTGSGAGQINVQYSESGSLTASTPVTISLDTDATRLDGLGNALVLTKVNAIYVKNTNTPGSGGTLTVGAATNPWLGPLGGTTPTVALPPGAAMLFYDFDGTGWPVTGGSAFNLKLDPGSTACTYTLIALGS